MAKELRAHLRRRGLSGYHFHGLRHTTGDALAENGATQHEIMAILGHTTLAMAERYTRRAGRKKMVIEGMAKPEIGRTRTERETRNRKKWV